MAVFWNVHVLHFATIGAGISSIVCTALTVLAHVGSDWYFIHRTSDPDGWFLRELTFDHACRYVYGNQYSYNFF